MNPEARLTILFDCCHSGSACELPFVYRPDAEGNVNLVDTLKKGIALVQGAHKLVSGGFTPRAMDDAKMLLGGATDFFRGLSHRDEAEVDEDGLAKENFTEDWHNEGKDVWMFSGCADHQTSADTSIAGLATGAMSWAFLGTLRENPNQSYIDVHTLALSQHSYPFHSQFEANYSPDTSKHSRSSAKQIFANSPA
jgi:metacaspase-1